MNKKTCGFAALALLIATGAWAAAVERFEIKAQSLSEALRVYADQTGEQIVFFSEIGKGLKSSEVVGSFTREQALERLLNKTGLKFERLNAKTIAITDASTRNSGSAISYYKPTGQPSELMRVAQVTETARKDADPKEDTRKTDAASKDAGEGGTLVVTGSRVPRTEIEGASPLLQFDRKYIERSGFATLEEFMRVLPQNFSAAGAGRQTVPNDENPSLSVRQPAQSGLGLRGLGSNNTLVLINGRRAPLSGRGNTGTPTQQSFFDINTIPIGLIDRIEILTDGASAVYGTDAIAGVVNIILREEYNSTEFKTRFGGTQHGGGFERNATLTHGFNVGKLQITSTLDGYQREALFGKQRPFSATADHTSQGGSNFSSNIGYPNTIFALAGQTIPGVFNPNGTPATQAVIPSGQNGIGLTAANFAGLGGATAFYNQAELYSLITPTKRLGFTSRLNFPVSERLNFFGEAAYTYIDSSALANPIFTSNTAGNTTLGRIPANNPFNPFGVPLGFRMTYLEAGPRDLVAETKSARAVAGMQYDLGGEWSMEVSTMYYLQRMFTSSPSTNNAAVQAALNQTNPALALNVFGDFRSGPTNAPGVYESIIAYNLTDSDSTIYSGDFLFRGPVWRMPAGAARTAFGAEWNRQDRVRTTNTPSIVAPALSEEQRDDYAMYGELHIPFFSQQNRLPMLHRLELQLAGRWQEIEGAGHSFDPKYGLVWGPNRHLLFRGTFGTGYRAPALSELERPEQNGTQNIQDPKRLPANYPGLPATYSVATISGSFPNLEPETSKTYGYGVVIQVPWIEGLSFSFDGYRKDQENLTASLTVAQLVTFEDLFPDRITRAAPSAADTAAGRPGPITQVDGRFSNFGQVVTSGWDGSVSYNLQTSNLGQFMFRVMGTYLASYKVAFNPGDPLVERRGEFGFPQKIKGNVSLFWDRDRWGGAIFVYHQGRAERSATDIVDPWTTVDMSLSFDWSDKIKLQGGIGNLFDEEPPFANTTWGFDGGFHNAKMRTYHATATYRF